MPPKSTMQYIVIRAFYTNFRNNNTNNKMNEEGRM